MKTDANGDIEWDRVYGGSFYSVGNWVEQTEDGGYIVTGEYNMAYLWLLKTDEEGYMVWQDTIDAGGYEVGYSVNQTTDGGYIVTGSWGADLLLLKTDREGNTIWKRIYGGPTAQRGRCVKQTVDGGYIAVGLTEFGDADGNILLLKVDKDGDSLWSFIYGGGEEEEGYSVEQTSDGGYIIVGETRSFGQGNYDVWLLKTDANGDTLWTRTYGWERVDQAYSVQQTRDGGYVFTGNTTMFSGDWRPDVLLIKTDSLGYVGVEEPPVTHQPDWQVISSFGRTITLRYADRPQGFHANIYDASGRKIDEVSSTSQSGSITWGDGHQVGVYFIIPISRSLATARKVVLVK